jgi:RNA polymerase sigma-70 factor (ECF subfamily)
MREGATSGVTWTSLLPFLLEERTTMNEPAEEPEIDDALRRVRGGDVAAFETVVRRYAGRLRAWLAVQAPPGVDTDEVAQRTFVAAFTRLEEFEPGTRFAAWLFTIARFQLRTETTRLRRVADYHSRYAPDLLQRELDRRGTQPPELWEARLESLRECVGALGEPLRRFIAWRYEEEIPLEEMAIRSGRSVAAVKKQLWALRQALQQCVERRMATAEGGRS